MYYFKLIFILYTNSYYIRINNKSILLISYNCPTYISKYVKHIQFKASLFRFKINLISRIIKLDFSIVLNMKCFFQILNSIEYFLVINLLY